MFPRRQSSRSCIITNNPCPHWFPGYRAFKSPDVNNIANFVCTLPNVVANALKSVYESIFNVTIIKNHSFSAHCFQVDRLCYLLYPGRGNVQRSRYHIFLFCISSRDRSSECPSPSGKPLMIYDSMVFHCLGGV